MGRKRKYPKTNGYWVYSHTTPNGMVYFGVSKLQPCRRWQKETYKGKSLEPFLESWDLMEHTVIMDALSKNDAYALEDWYIQNTPNSINKHRSGLIESDMKEYAKKRYQEHKEEIKQYYQENKEEYNEYMKQYMREYRAKKKN